MTNELALVLEFKLYYSCMVGPIVGPGPGALIAVGLCRMRNRVGDAPLEDETFLPTPVLPTVVALYF